jgi:preprotein translocase subunit YajC
MTAALQFLAQDGSDGSSPFITLAPLLLIFVAMYFLMIKPQQRRARAQRELIGSIDVGDEVITIGGMYGVVREVDEDSIVIEISPGNQVRFVKSAIARKLVLDKEEGEEEYAEEEADDER